MRILWVLNICPPAAAEALGMEYSVREGWIPDSGCQQSARLF